MTGGVRRQREALRGTVTGVDRARGRIAVAVEGGGFTVAALRDAGAVRRGDVLAGPLRSPGAQVLRGPRSGVELRVFVEAHGATPERARRLLAGEG